MASSGRKSGRAGIRGKANSSYGVKAAGGHSVKASAFGSGSAGGGGGGRGSGRARSRRDRRNDDYTDPDWDPFA